MNRLVLKVDKDEERLDRFLAEHEKIAAESLSRTRIQELIRQGLVRVNGRMVEKPNFRLNSEDAIEIELPEPTPLDVLAEPLPIEIVHQDADLAVVIKPAGMMTHPAGSIRSGTLVNALLYHLDGLSGIGGKLRPGIVHRLDKGTSGLILVARNDRAHQALSLAFKKRTIQKSYLALAQGRLKETKGVIEFPITRHKTRRHQMAAVVRPVSDSESTRHKIRNALTRYECLKSWNALFLVALHPETGRTHQLRVHLAQIGHPILGDEPYGYRWNQTQGIPRRLIEQLNGPALHACKLEFLHPTSGQLLCFEIPAPPRMQQIVESLEKS